MPTNKDAPITLPKFKTGDGVDTAWSGGTVKVYPMEAYDWLGREIKREGRIPLCWIPDVFAHYTNQTIESYESHTDQTRQLSPKTRAPVVRPKVLLDFSGVLTYDAPLLAKLKGFFITSEAMPTGHSFLESILPRNGIQETNDTNNLVVITGADFSGPEPIITTGISPQPINLFTNTADPTKWVGGELLILAEVSAAPSGSSFAASNTLLVQTAQPWLFQSSPITNYTNAARAQFNAFKVVYSKLKVVVCSYGDRVDPGDGPWADMDHQLSVMFGAQASNSVIAMNMAANAAACAGIPEIEYHDVGTYAGTEAEDTARANAMKAIFEAAIDAFVA